MPFLIGLYLFAALTGYCASILYLLIGTPPAEISPLLLGFKCIAAGGIGGCIYCLRAMYLNIAVHKRWDSAWYVWYFIRPVMSGCSGGVAYVFMKAGLLVLESGQKPEATDIGFYCLAFIAGLNVDKFLKKIEDVGQTMFGIEKSRSAQEESSGDKNV